MGVAYIIDGCGCGFTLTIAHAHQNNTNYSNNKFILDVGMEKQQKQELRWRVSVLPIPAFHVILHIPSTQWGMGNTDTLHLNYF